MHSTRRAVESSSVLAIGYLAFFVLAPALIAGTVRIGWYSLPEVALATLLGAAPTAYLWLRTRHGTTLPTTAYYTPLASVLFALAMAATLGALLAIPSLDALRITREYERVETLPMRLVNLHLVATFLAASWLFSARERRLAPVLAVVLAVAVSLTVSFAEGRRTAAVLPVAIVGVLWLSSSSTARQVLVRAAVTACAGASVFLAVTSVRVESSVDPGVAYQAIASRLFNTGTTALELFASEDRSFDPKLVAQTTARVKYVFGVGTYSSRTNEYGVHYGFLPPTNSSVGINPGVVVESYLGLGLAYIILLGLVIEASLWLLRTYRSLFFGADVLVALLLVHAVQMELPYTIGLLVRLASAAIPLALFRSLTRRLHVSPPSTTIRPEFAPQEFSTAVR